MIKVAAIENLEVVKDIVYNTILKIYPDYYPKEVVDFFLNHHNEENIIKDIQTGSLYLLSKDNKFIATGTIEGEYMNRVFVVPEYQGRGYGSQMMNFLESKIATNHNRICIDSSLPAFDMYLKRGYKPIDYNKEVVENGKVLCYAVMEKKIYSHNNSGFNLNNRLFTSVSNTVNGEVSKDTLFHYYQNGSTLWASYSGGEIEKGYLVGKFIKEDQIYFTYQHINIDSNIRIGECSSTLKKLPDGRLILNESWKWLNGDKSSGSSTIEEKKD